MVGGYRTLFEQGFSRVDPERAHHLGFAAIRAGAPVLRALPGLGGAVATAPVEAFGLSFPHAFGLAAGFDKNGVGIDALGALGFGHVEIGTVTGEPQSGNPKPRLFRLPRDRAIINRMGFNNDGAAVVAERLRARDRRRDHDAPAPVLGINIGKTKVVPEDEAIADYEKSTHLLAPLADYLVVNVSSPNTPGLRDLQATEKLAPLLSAVRERADAVVSGRRVPLLVKIAPDLSDEDVLAVADLSLELGLDGIIATNTTISRSGLRTDTAQVDGIGAGGLSGAPVKDRSLAVLRLLAARVQGRLDLIGVGGIGTAQDAQERLDAGATLVQGYTGFIYHGPFWPRQIVAGLDHSIR